MITRPPRRWGAFDGYVFSFKFLSLTPANRCEAWVCHIIEDLCALPGGTVALATVPPWSLRSEWAAHSEKGGPELACTAKVRH